jgi:hypothetical protein
MTPVYGPPGVVGPTVVDPWWPVIISFPASAWLDMLQSSKMATTYLIISSL